MSRVETSPGVGAVLAGRYRLDARVGVGRTGTVFRAFDQALNTTVAVKVLNPGPFSGSDRAINVFRVNRVLAYRHDGLVRVQDVSLVPTAASRVLFLVEDWIDGRSFDAYIRGRNPLQNWEILEAFRQLSSALGFIHKIGVHGNLTPANVLVVDGRRLVLTDCYDVLGLPPPSDAVAASFRAPELADTTSGREDPASDIWSLGMMLGMALLRSPVHPGVRLSAQGPGVPYEADAVFLRATERDPRRRFGGVDEMVDAMRMALPGEPAVVEAVGFVGRQRSEVSINAETRTAGAETSTRRPSALQVAPDEALDWVDESSPEIDWTDVETVAEWADEAGDWSAAEVVDDAAIESLELDDATVLVEVDAVVPAPLPAPIPAPIAAPAPARTPTVPARTPTVPSRARSRTAPGFDSTDSAVTPQAVEVAAVPEQGPVSAPESGTAIESVSAVEPVSAPEPALAPDDEAVLESAPTLELVAPAPPDAADDAELEPGPDTIETIAEPAPVTPPPQVDDDELALEALTAPTAASEPPAAAELVLGGPPEALPIPSEVDVAPADVVTVVDVPEDELGDTLEITPEAPPERKAAVDAPLSAVPPLLVDDDLPEPVEAAPAPPPVPLDDDDNPSPTLEVPMTFRSDAPPLVLDVKAPDPVPPPTLPAPAEVPPPAVSEPAPVPASTPAPPPAVDDRGKGKKKNKQKGAAPAAPPAPAAVVAAPVVAAATPAAPAPASIVATTPPVVPAAVVPSPVVPTPPVAVAPVAPAVAVAPAAPPPPSAPVTVAKPAAAPAPRPAPNTAVIATPKVPSAPPPRPAPAPASKPMSWGVVLIGGFAAVIGIAVLVWFATSNKQSTPKVQKAVSVAPAAPVGGASAPAVTPATESGALAAQAGSMDVSTAAAAPPDAGSPVAPDTSSTAAPLTAVALDAGADVAIVADDVAALDTADVPDVSDTLDTADTSTDTADTATALVAADDVEALDTSDVEALPDAAVAETPDTAVADVPAIADVPAALDVPAVAALDAQVGADAASAGGVDLRFIPPELLACPTGMAKLSKKMKYDVGGQKQDGFETYCIDRREFPGAGMPRTGVGLYAAKGACERKGGRLCTGAEWRRGCGGTYPYGSTFDESRCNTMTLDGTSREVVATGSFGRCRSGSGLSDMVGNVAEWTADGMVRGGDAYKTGQEATCGFARRRAPDSGSPHVGFRCCADPVLGDAPAEESP